MSETKEKSKAELFVEYVTKRASADTAFCARLKRGDNPNTEYQSWEHLSSWCDLEKEWERKPYALISSAIANSKSKKEGSLGLGMAIALSYDDRSKSDAAKAKLRRILACSSKEEVCLNLRSLLKLIGSRGVSISYSKLLNDILYFGTRVKSRWASDFYGRVEKDDSISS